MSQKTNPLFQRFNSERSSKIKTLAEESSSGAKSGFGGIFQVQRASDEQRKLLKSALQIYCPPKAQTFDGDVEKLMQLMLEVKAISHQALLLHGQRIQSAKEILSNYREGAFSTWLVNAYGNRQTPYNFLQYFEFFQALPEKHRPLVEKMPRQVVYQLASRKDHLLKKLALIERCAGLSARNFLQQLRRELPLKPLDQRRARNAILALLERLKDLIVSQRADLSADELAVAQEQILSIDALLRSKP